MAVIVPLPTRARTGNALQKVNYCVSLCLAGVIRLAVCLRLFLYHHLCKLCSSAIAITSHPAQHQSILQTVNNMNIFITNTGKVLSSLEICCSEIISFIVWLLYYLTHFSVYCIRKCNNSFSLRQNDQEKGKMFPQYACLHIRYKTTYCLKWCHTALSLDSIGISFDISNFC